MNAFYKGNKPLELQLASKLSQTSRISNRYVPFSKVYSLGITIHL